MHGPIFLSFYLMENTLLISVESAAETWELSDDLVLQLENYKAEHPIAADNSNADNVHQAWFATLTQAEQQKVTRHKTDNATK
jgi:hypothetical protein